MCYFNTSWSTNYFKDFKQKEALILKLSLQMKKICVLITVFNRIEDTLICLDNMFNSFDYYNVRNNFLLDVYIVDDGSTDGTSKKIRKLYPNINLIKGSGDLFWNRGMLLAWKTAIKNNEYDFFIWLNNDVAIHQKAFVELFECSQEYKGTAIVSGIINSENEEVIYGGRNEKKELLKAIGLCQSIKYLNGNLVLIPQKVFKKLGCLDDRFHHDLGDVDYGFRAMAEGITVVTSKSVLGIGEVNKIERSRKNGLGLRQRFRALQSPLGYPLQIAFYFHNKHYNFLKAMFFVFFLVAINLMPDWVYFKLGKRFLK